MEYELLRYYLWHVYRCPFDTLGQMVPKYRAHVSVILPLHGEKAMEESKKYDGEKVEVSYSGEILKGGRALINNRPHVNYWMKVYCDRADEIKKELGVVENNFLGFHLTVSSNKGFNKQFI